MEIPTRVSCLSDSTVGALSRLLQIQGFTLTRNPRFPVKRIVFCHLGVHKETWERNSYFLAHQVPNLTYITVHAVTQLSEEHISVFPRHREETCFKMPESCNGEPETAQAVALSAASLSTLLKPSSQTPHSTLAITPTWQNHCSCLLSMVVSAGFWK